MGNKLESLMAERVLQRIEAEKRPSVEDMKAEIAALKTQQNAQQNPSNAAARQKIEQIVGLFKRQ